MNVCGDVSKVDHLPIDPSRAYKGLSSRGMQGQSGVLHIQPASWNLLSQPGFLYPSTRVATHGKQVGDAIIRRSLGEPESNSSGA